MKQVLFFSLILLYIKLVFPQQIIKCINGKTDLNITKDPPVLSLAEVSLKFIDKNSNTYINDNESANTTFSIINRSKGSTTDLMIFIQGGTFQMGSNDGESDEKPVHSVKVNDFYIGKYEVTVEQFKQFITATAYKTDADKEGWSYCWKGSTWEKKNGINWKYDVSGTLLPESENNHPVIHVSWNDAKAYCEWLSKKTGKKYQLPTEAEWEYAAKGGALTSSVIAYKYAGSNTLSEVAWFSENSNNKIHAVGQKSPNEEGLYDMSGNVWEWCSDWYKGYPGSSGVTDYTGSLRVLRGGGWSCNEQFCRSATRGSNAPSYRDTGIGFRLVSPK